MSFKMASTGKLNCRSFLNILFFPELILLSSYAIILYSLVQHNATYREESLTAFVFTERIQSLTMCVLHLAS